VSTPSPKLPGDDKVEPIVVLVAILALIAYAVALGYDSANPIH